MSVTISFSLDRTGVSMPPEKSDKDTMLEWLDVILASTNPGNALDHLIAGSVRDAAQAGTESFKLTPLQFVYMQMALARANVPGNNNRIFVQVLSKFGIGLLPHDPA